MSSRRLSALTFSQVRLTDTFWTRYRETLVKTTLPHSYAQIVETGRLENFYRAAKKLAGEEAGDFQGLWFNDSDVYKWIEACAYALAQSEDATVRHQMDEAVRAVIAAQEPSGYVNTFFQLRHPDLKWRNLNTMHEMYCGGHLVEAGVGMFEALGDRRLLDVAVKFADHVMSIFGPDKKVGYCGHQEFELALIRLAEATKASKYAEYAKWMIEQRGHRPSPFEAELRDEEAMRLSPHALRMLSKQGDYNGEYAQDHAPIREQTEIVGHAVRAMYYYIAAAEFAPGDEELESALARIWSNLTKRRMYVTGGIGPSASNEGFTADYDLPNLSAYAETCAAIGLVFWGSKMLEMTGDGDFADVVERALFNGVLSGISLSGDKFFYANPLESRGRHQRVPWFECACCPPNISRLLASIHRVFVGASQDAFYVHIPASLEADVVLGGVRTAIKIEAAYPFDGKFKIHVSPERPARFALKVRIPEWADDVNTDLPSQEEEAGFESGYMVFDRTWKKGEVLEVEYEMAPKWVESDPRVLDNLGRTALTFGPLVYCAEESDLGFVPQCFSVDPDAEVTVESQKILNGIRTLTVEGIAESPDFVDGLYSEIGTTEVREATARFIPYYTWANRGATHMQVWFRKV